MAKIAGLALAALLAWLWAATVALADEHGRWQKLENNPACVVWNANPQSNETVTWSGACVNGKAQGRGVLVWPDGERYEGEYRDGERTGRGVYVTANGDRYEGDWKDGEPHGRGVYVWADGDECEGDWREGKLLGMGEALLEIGQWRKVWACWWLSW